MPQKSLLRPTCLGHRAGRKLNTLLTTARNPLNDQRSHIFKPLLLLGRIAQVDLEQGTHRLLVGKIISAQRETSHNDKRDLRLIHRLARLLSLDRCSDDLANRFDEAAQVDPHQPSNVVGVFPIQQRDKLGIGIVL